MDITFKPEIEFNGRVRAIVLDTNQRIVAGGAFTQAQGNTVGRIVRLDQNGDFDSSFLAGSGANRTITCIEILSNGKMMVGGDFTEFNGVSSRGLALLNSDGSVDTSFTSLFSENGFSSGVNCLEALPGGEIMVGGYFTEYDNQPVGRLIMIDSTGAISSQFTSGAFADSHVFDIDLLPDGKILICGFFKSVSEVQSSAVARLLPNGAVDTSFSTNSELGPVAYTVAAQTNNKVIAGGYFSSFFGRSREHLVRLNSDGGLDEAFVNNGLPDSNIYNLQVDTQDRILVAGQFQNIGNVTAPGLARLLADGSLDSSFATAEPISVSFTQEYPFDDQKRVYLFGWNDLSKPTAIIRLLWTQVLSPGDQWLSEHFGEQILGDDLRWQATPGNDSVTNLQKYALGYQGDPTQPIVLWGDDGLLRGLWLADNDSGFYFSTDERRTDAEVTVEWSDTLHEWFQNGLSLTEVEREGDIVLWKATVAGEHQTIFFRVDTRLLLID